MNDEILQSYREGMSAPSYCKLPRTCNQPTSAAGGATERRRIPARDLTLPTIHFQRDGKTTPPESEHIRCAEQPSPAPEPPRVRRKNDDYWRITFDTTFGLLEWRIGPQGLISSPERHYVHTRCVFREQTDDYSSETVGDRITVSFTPGQFVTRCGCIAPTEVVAGASGRFDYNFVSMDWICEHGVAAWFSVDCPPAPAKYLENIRFPDDEPFFGKKLELDGAVTLTVSIEGYAPRRVTFFVFNDECHHTEQMIINRREFDDHEALHEYHQRRDMPPGTAAGKPRWRDEPMPTAMPSPILALGHVGTALDHADHVGAPCGPSDEGDNTPPQGTNVEKAQHYDKTILNGTTREAITPDSIWIWTVVMPPVSAETPRETRSRSKSNSLAPGRPRIKCLPAATRPV